MSSGMSATSLLIYYWPGELKNCQGLREIFVKFAFGSVLMIVCKRSWVFVALPLEIQLSLNTHSLHLILISQFVFLYKTVFLLKITSSI